MSCGYYCSVSLPHGAVDWAVVYECDVSWSYSLTFRDFMLFFQKTREGSDDEDGATGGGKGSDSDSSSSSDEDVSINAEYYTS